MIKKLGFQRHVLRLIQRPFVRDPTPVAFSFWFKPAIHKDRLEGFLTCTFVNSEKDHIGKTGYAICLRDFSRAVRFETDGIANHRSVMCKEDWCFSIRHLR